jgi:alanine racemase
VGDEVEIVSPDAEAPNSVENLARLANTITPEVMSRFGGPRIRRVTTT